MIIQAGFEPGISVNWYAVVSWGFAVKFEEENDDSKVKANARGGGPPQGPASAPSEAARRRIRPGHVQRVGDGARRARRATTIHERRGAAPVRDKQDRGGNRSRPETLVLRIMLGRSAAYRTPHPRWRCRHSEGPRREDQCGPLRPDSVLAGRDDQQRDGGPVSRTHGMARWRRTSREPFPEPGTQDSRR